MKTMLGNRSHSHQEKLLQINSKVDQNIYPRYCSDQTAPEAHKALISALEIKTAAHQCSLDWFGEILDRKLFRELGYSSINQYAKDALGFSKTKIGDYIKLSRKMKAMPHLKEALNNGKLGYTSGRLIAEIADEKSEKNWVGFALENPRKVVEEEVKRAKTETKNKASRQPSLLPEPMKKTPAAVVPVRVHFDMSPIQFARYERMWEKVRKQRNVSAEKVEALLEMMEAYLESVEQEKAPRGVPSTKALAPAQIHIHHCPECESSVLQTSKGELEIGKSEFERAQCDCQVNKPGQRNTASIAPSIKRKVLTRARHKCEMPGCDHTRFLEIHHKVPRASGGTNDQCNLQVLCSGCHSLIHKRGAGFLVKDGNGVYVWDKKMGIGQQKPTHSHQTNPFFHRTRTSLPRRLS